MIWVKATNSGLIGEIRRWRNFVHSGQPRAEERLSEISFLKYQLLKPQRLVLHSTLRFLTWHNKWAYNGRQVKKKKPVWEGKWHFLEQLMSNKQLWNKFGLITLGQAEQSGLGGSLWQRSCGVSHKVSVGERSKNRRRSSSSCARRLRNMSLKTGNKRPRASAKGRVTSSVTTPFNIHLSAILRF